MSLIVQGITAVLVFLGISCPIIVVGVIYYLKKRLEHTQIMAAIEKGTPLSELIPPKPKPAGPVWIKYLSLGAGMVVIGAGLLLSGRGSPGTLIVCVILGVGICWLIRGLLHRKYYLKNQLANNNNAVESKK